MAEVSINEAALESMESLLGEQFAATLDFCCVEFERLGSEVLATIGQDKEASVRHAHSLNNDNLAQATAASAQLMTQVAQSQTLLNNWLASR
ncbi:MAG: Hpt domain-containing protein [Pseudoalteromonas nigrifaciens]|uniref:Hpt domain-containing protein n=1 Tax=Pseudoalteromonas nigrifaciens TaxID=28109 RepID=UPI003F9649A1